MQISIISYTGSADDFIKVRPALEELAGRRGAVHTSVAVVEEIAKPQDPQITFELVELVLTRRYLSPSARKVFKALLDAGSEGLNTSEMAKAAGISRKKLSGVFGAFGRRVAHTEGWPEGKSFVDVVRDDDREGEWRYRLTAIVRSVLESGRIKL